MVRARQSIAVVGVGAMGRQHARVIAESPRVDLAGVVDVDGELASRVANDFNCPSARELGGLGNFDAVVFATPTETHEEFAISAIGESVPVLIEKPLASHFSAVERIVERSLTGGVPILCGLVERYNPALLTISEMIDEPVRHWVSMRHSPRNDRIRTGVVEDLLIHDLDLVLRLWEEYPHSISASDWCSEETGLQEVVDASIGFCDGLALLSANRWGQRKVRMVSVYTDSRLFEADLVRETVTVYSGRGQELQGTVFSEETVVRVPFIRNRVEPLVRQLDYFVDLIEGAEIREEAESILAVHRLASQVLAEIRSKT